MGNLSLMNLVIVKNRIYVKQSFRTPDGRTSSKIVKKLGKTEDYTAEEIAALRRKFSNADEKEKALAEGAALATALKNADAEAGQTEIPRPRMSYAMIILRKLWNEEIGPDYLIRKMADKDGITRCDMADTVAFMALSKAIDPRSVRGSLVHSRMYLGTGVSACSLDDFYTTLGFMGNHKDEILRLFAEKTGSLPSGNSMLFYDVTNAYFETALTDEEKGMARNDLDELWSELIAKYEDKGLLDASQKNEDGSYPDEALPEELLGEFARESFLRMRGPSKEHRMDLPIVSVALVIDDKGMPLDFEMFSGNAAEISHMENSICKLQRKYGVRNVTVVADRGLGSVPNLKMLQAKGLGFIIAQKLTNIGKDVTEQIFSDDGWEMMDGGGKSKFIPGFEKKGTGGESITCNLLVFWNKTRETRDLAVLAQDRETAEKAVKAKGQIRKASRSWQALVVTDSKTPNAESINEAAYEKRKKLCGYSAVVWLCPPSSPDSIKKEDIAGVYHRLERIEECFRIMKSNLCLRPMFVRTAEHIRGHVLCCVLALIIIRLVERKLAGIGEKLSPDRICAAMKDANCSVSATPGGLVFVTDSDYSWAKDTLEAIGNEKTAEKVNGGELKPDLTAIEKALGVKPVPAICAKGIFERCFGRRFATNDALVGDFVSRLKLPK